MQPTPQDCRRSPLSWRRLYAELYCLVFTFVFHEGNNHSRKAGTILVVGVWAAIEVGAAFGYATLPDRFMLLRVGVGILVGRMWGIEINNVAGVELGYSGGNDDDE